MFPLRRDVPLSRVHENGLDDYAFVAVAGDGVHEIPVGPVHAGTIEPGHFRFSIVGEKVLRLEERLGYKHKAIDKLFEGRDLLSGSRLAGRVSGDSTVAYAWAYAMAVEGTRRASSRHRARCGSARWRWSASASQITSAISATSATTAGSRSGSPSSCASRRTCCGSTPRCSATAT